MNNDKLIQELRAVIAHNNLVNKNCYAAIKSLEGGQPSGSTKKKRISEAAAKAVANRRATIFQQAAAASARK